jgi:hypothetical protein
MERSTPKRLVVNRYRPPSQTPTQPDCTESQLLPVLSHNDHYWTGQVTEEQVKGQGQQQGIPSWNIKIVCLLL